jgi:hypothetical protein
MDNNTQMPRCIYCGELHPPVFAEHDSPNSMGHDAASQVMTQARRRLLKPPSGDNP